MLAGVTAGRCSAGVYTSGRARRAGQVADGRRVWAGAGRAVAARALGTPALVLRKTGLLQRQVLTSSAARQSVRWQRVSGQPTRALFTGIVQGKGKVVNVDRKPGFSSIRIQFPAGAMVAVQIGASVAINGTCLTVVSADGDVCSFDIIEESLRRTNLGKLSEGSEVNFERSAKMGDEIGGHTVSGHVHCTAQITKFEETENNRRLVFEVPQEWMKYVLEKGFISVDGCSLTVGEVGPNWFSVYLIPETLRVTVLGDKRLGDTVNIEVEAQTQAIVNTVEKVVARYMADQQLLAPGVAA